MAIAILWILVRSSRRVRVDLLCRELVCFCVCIISLIDLTPRYTRCFRYRSKDSSRLCALGFTLGDGSYSLSVVWSLFPRYGHIA